MERFAIRFPAFGPDIYVHVHHFSAPEAIASFIADKELSNEFKAHTGRELLPCEVTACPD